MEDSGSDGPRILVVHGRDFKPDAAALTELVHAALRAGLERDYPDCLERFDTAEVLLAYYGDLSNRLLESRGKQYDPALDIADRNNALNALREVPERRRFGFRQYDMLPGKSALPEFVADVGAPVLGTIGLTMPVLARIAPDFHEYLAGESDYAGAVRARVRDALISCLGTDRRLLLLAHGTGSVIAYDVLWQLSHDDRHAARYGHCKVEVLVTLGSPLGSASVRKKLLGAGAGGDAVYPANVISWYNLSAEDDYACYDATLANDFSKMLKRHLISRIRDYRVFNLAVRYGRSNPHSSVGYYIHPRTARILSDWLRLPVVAQPTDTP
jgi:hypothetical protein